MRVLALTLLALFSFSFASAQPPTGWVPKLKNLKSPEGDRNALGWAYVVGAYEAWLATIEPIAVHITTRAGGSESSARLALRECIGGYNVNAVYELALNAADRFPDEPVAPFVVRTMQLTCAGLLFET